MSAINPEQSSREETATAWPVAFAVGVATLLVGLIVNPEVIATLAPISWESSGSETAIAGSKATGASPSV